MNEFELIKKIKQKNYQQSTLEKGIGDDAAVFSQTQGKIVTAVDMFVENIHFNRETMSPWHIGYKSLAANLSDMAAMGARPTYYLVAISIPNSWTSNEITEIFTGMKSLADQHRIDLIGGDTVSGNQLTISITIIGQINEYVRYRHLSKENDVVFITGTLGDSQAGLHILKNNLNISTNQKYLIQRHQMPTPRVNFAKALIKISRVALNDVSDGIASEAMEIAEASNVSIHIKEKMIPLSESLQKFPVAQRFNWVFFGGEDFELLGTVSEKNWSKVKEIAQQTDTQITKIGSISLKNPGKVFLYNDNGQPILLKKQGYTHLQ